MYNETFINGIFEFTVTRRPITRNGLFVHGHNGAFVFPCLDTTITFILCFTAT